MKKSLTLIFALVLSLWASAHDFVVNDIYYSYVSKADATVGVDHKTSTSNDSDSYSGVLTIPDEVTYEGVTYKVVSILERAFQGTRSLTKVVLGSNIKDIAQYAFLHTYGLNAVEVGSNRNFTTVDGVLYTADKTRLLFCPRNATSLVVASDTEVIDDFSLEQCTSLSSVTLSAKTKRLGVSSFYACTSLTSLDLLQSVEIIDRAAFKNAKNVKSLTGTEAVKSIGISALEQSGVEELNLLSIETLDEYAVMNSGLKKVVIGGSLTTMGKAALKNSTLTSVTILSGAKVIGEQAFMGSQITSIDCSTVDQIGMSAFMNCSKLSSVTLGANTYYIDSQAFSGCSKLTDITCLSNSVPTIQTNSFSMKAAEAVTVRVPASVLDQYKEKWTPKMADASSVSVEFVGIGFSKVAINATFPDEVFMDYVSKNFDLNGDGVLSVEEQEPVTSIDVHGLGIQSLEGINIFTNLDSLDCSQNSLVSLNLFDLSKLSYLNANENGRSIGNARKSGFTIEGLDISRIKADDIIGASISGDKLVPNDGLHGAVVYYYMTKCPNADFEYVRFRVEYNPVCLVSFVKSDGTLISSVEVNEGSSLTPPDAPSIEGYEFTGWSVSDFSNITNDITAVAQYERVKVAGEIEISRDVFRDEVIYDIALSFDDDNSGTLTPAELSEILFVNIDTKGLFDQFAHLEDINYFTSMESLSIANAYLDEYDFSSLTSLKSLSLTNVAVEDTLFLNSLPSLESLNIYHCEAVTVDLSQNVNLESLTIKETNLLFLNLDSNAKLNPDYVDINDGKLYIYDFDINNGIDFGPYGLDNSRVDFWLAPSGSSSADGTVSRESNGVFYPSKGTTYFTIQYKTNNESFPSYKLRISFQNVIFVDESTFPDETFRNYVSSNIDKDGDGKLTVEEQQAVTSLSLRWKYISDLKGVEYFTNLESLDVELNSLIALDLSTLSKLKSFSCKDNVRKEAKGSFVSSKSGFYINGLDCSRINPNTIYNGKLVDGKFYPASNSSYLAYDYATNCPNPEFAYLRVQISYNRLVMARFIDMDGTVLSVEEVEPGSAVELPSSAGSHSGYTFKGWSEDSITALYYDTDVYAVYEMTPGGSADVLKIAINEDNFPDSNFRREVKDYDTDKDGYLSSVEAFAVKDMQISVRNISNLKGIEYFTELTTLIINGNKLSEVDLSHNTKLRSLQCYKNKIAHLDLSSNKMLGDLYCKSNEMQTLILPEGDALYNLECEDNLLTDLDISMCHGLKYFVCSNNSLTHLSTLGTRMYSFTGTENVCNITAGSEIVIDGLDLSCVRNLSGATIGEYGLIPTASTITYDYLAGYAPGKNEVDECLLGVTINHTKGNDDEVAISEENFPDANFRAYISSKFDLDGNGTLSRKEIFAVTRINVSKMGITTLKGIEFFVNLVQLNCSDNHLVMVDLSNNTSILKVNADNNIREATQSMDNIGVVMPSELNTDFVTVVNSDKVDNTITYEYLYPTGNATIGNLKFTYVVTLVETALDVVTVEDGPAEYFDLYGRKVNASTKGIIIKRQNGKTVKMLVK